jgi:hypothetical protein
LAEGESNEAIRYRPAKIVRIAILRQGTRR